MIEGYMYQYATITQHCPGFGSDELDEEYLTQEALDKALTELREDARKSAHHFGIDETTFTSEWHWHN